MTASLLLVLFFGYMMQYRWLTDGLLPKASKAAQAVVQDTADNQETPAPAPPTTDSADLAQEQASAASSHQAAAS